ncbi:MAG: PIG-L family deacetylase [Clostridia bacterium]|nr:PIG-L family deacetylase [Clostridia bacterium]
MKRLLLIFLALFCLPGAGFAAEAPELTGSCRFSSDARSTEFSLMTDGSLGTYFPFGDKGRSLEIHCDSPVWGVSVSLFNRYGQPMSYDLEVQTDSGWQKAAEGGEYLVHWHALSEGATALRLVCTSKERLRIAELRLFGPGDRPAEVQDWQTLDKCDLMLLSTHPDDELLWFGGLLPTYAGERGLRVQVAVMVPCGGERQLELLGAVWHCGVRAYPAFLGFVDNNGGSVKGQYSRWRGKERVQRVVTRVIRQYRPEVLVTHGEQGEYGHAAHKTTADVAKTAVELAASAKKFPQSAKEQGTWQVKKLYLHEYEKRPLICDWDQPLSAFGGLTGYEVAEAAFRFHASQVRRDWHFERHGEHDNARFGLYSTTVGNDTGLGDFMEHIPLDSGI